MQMGRRQSRWGVAVAVGCVVALSLLGIPRLFPDEANKFKTCEMAEMSPFLALQLQVGMPKSLLEKNAVQEVETRRDGSLVHLVTAYHAMPTRTARGQFERFGADGEALVRLTHSSMARYARRHGYGFSVVLKTALVENRAPQWGRLALLAFLIHSDMQKRDRPRWYLWLDSDIFVFRRDALPEEWLASAADLLYTEDPPFEANVNTGVLLLRNERRSLALLDQWYLFGDVIGKRYRALHEQDALLYLSRLHWWQQRLGVLFLDGRNPQMFQRFHKAQMQCQVDETLFCHFAAERKSKRMAQSLEMLMQRNLLSEFLMEKDVEFARSFARSINVQKQEPVALNVEILDAVEISFAEKDAQQRGLEKGALLSPCRYVRTDVEHIPAAPAGSIRKIISFRSKMVIVSGNPRPSALNEALWKNLEEYSRVNSFSLRLVQAKLTPEQRALSWGKLVALRAVIVDELDSGVSGAEWVIWVDPDVLPPANDAIFDFDDNPAPSTVLTGPNNSTRLVAARVSADALALLDLWWRVGSWLGDEHGHLQDDGNRIEQCIGQALGELMASDAASKFESFFGFLDDGNWLVFDEWISRWASTEPKTTVSMSRAILQLDSLRSIRGKELIQVAQRYGGDKRAGTLLEAESSVSEYAPSLAELLASDACLSGAGKALEAMSEPSSDWCLSTVLRSCKSGGARGLTVFFRRLWDEKRVIFAHVVQQHFPSVTQLLHYSDMSCSASTGFEKSVEKWGVLGAEHRALALSLESKLRASMWSYITISSQ